MVKLFGQKPDTNNVNRGADNPTAPLDVQEEQGQGQEQKQDTKVIVLKKEPGLSYTYEFRSGNKPEFQHYAVCNICSWQTHNPTKDITIRAIEAHMKESHSVNKVS